MVISIIAASSSVLPSAMPWTGPSTAMNGAR
jgi:hypothetical protein